MWRIFIGIVIVIMGLEAVAGFPRHSNGRASAESLGSATFAVVSPSRWTKVGDSVNVPIQLSSFTPGSSATWGGYELEVQYDDAVVNATADTIGASNPCGYWENVYLSPSPVWSGCAFESQTIFGFTMETITFQCVALGTSAIHFVLPGEAEPPYYGTTLFDEYAYPFDMTLVDGSVTCGPPPVGGIAEQPDVAALQATLTSPDHNMRNALGLALAALSVVGASAWYVRSRRGT